MDVEGTNVIECREIECSAILFDFDGVLVDSIGAIEDTWRYWAGVHGLDLELVLREAHGRRTAEVISALMPEIDADAEKKRIEAFVACGERSPVYPKAGAREFVRSLPHEKWAIVTSGGTSMVARRLSEARLPQPRVLVTADDVSTGKPAPEGYLAAAERLGAPAGDCVVVEDSLAGIEAARSAGMTVVAISGTHTPDEISSRSGFVVDSLERLAFQEDAAPGREDRSGTGGSGEKSRTTLDRRERGAPRVAGKLLLRMASRGHGA